MSEKSARKVSITEEPDNIEWSISLPLPAGGTCTVKASNNIGLLAAYQGLIAIRRAAQPCPVCNNWSLKLMERDSGGDSPFYSMQCQTWNGDKQCPGQLSFGVMKECSNMLVTSFKEGYREWYTGENGNGSSNEGNGGRSSRNDEDAPSTGRGRSSRSASSSAPAKANEGRTSRNSQSSAPRRPEQEQEHYYNQEVDDDGSDVPF